MVVIKVRAWRKPLTETIKCKCCGKMFKRLTKARRGRKTPSKYRAMNVKTCSSKCSRKRTK